MTRQNDAPPALRYLGFIQMQVEQGKIDVNLNRLEEILTRLAPPPHSLIVLPELWATGFAYGKLAELWDLVKALPVRLQGLAERYDILFAGSLPEPVDAENKLFFNSLEIIGKNGSCGKYRKRHLFPGEEHSFSPWAGAAPPIVTPWGILGCLVCYDLRFPMPARQQCQKGADLLLCSAEWPTSRITHWQTLVVARAIENQTFMVACNGVGQNGELPLGGHSLIVAPSGEILHEAGKEEEARVVVIDWQAKNDARIGFKSFSASPYQSSVEKISSAATCVAEAEIRAGIGQQVVYVALKKETEFLRVIEILEAARRQGDYLLVGVPLPDEGGLLPFAALGCVDAVFHLAELSPAAKCRLREICLDGQA